MKIAIYSIVVIGFMACACESSSDRLNDWVIILNQHLDKYPEMQADDIYKMVYQGIRGPGHLGADPDVISKYLKEELLEIEANPDIPLIENISPDSEFVRINLGKFKSLNLPADLLVQAVIRSSRELASDEKQLIKTCKGIKKQVKTGRLRTDYQKFLKLYQFIEENNFPPMHHSKRYIQCYSPSYRVVQKSVWQAILKHNIK